MKLLVAEQLAEKEKLWQEREENMKSLLTESMRTSSKRVVTSLTLGDAKDEDPFLTVTTLHPLSCYISPIISLFILSVSSV